MECQLDNIETSHALEMLNNLNEMRENKQQCDFTVCVGSEEFPAHKNILSAGCDYFKAMFSHDTIEASSGSVQMKNVDPDAVKICIDFIYSGKLSVNRKNVEELFHVASMMQLHKVVNIVVRFLEEDLSPHTFYSTKDIADVFSSQRLVDSCKKYAMTNFSSIVVQDEFKYLEYEFLSFLMGSNEIKASEAAKCKALIIWTKFDVETRKSNFGAMLSKLNLGKMSLRYRMYIVEKESLLLNATSCMNKIVESRMFKQSTVQPQDIDLEGDVVECNNVIAVFDATSKSAQGFDPQEKSWKKMFDITDEFVLFSYATSLVNDVIYVFVTSGENYALNYTDCNCDWVKLPDRTLTCNRVLSTVVGNVIYLFDDTGEASKVVEKFDIYSEAWSYATDRPLSVANSLASIIAVKNMIYVFGGHIVVNSAKYDTTRSEWSSVPKIPTKRYGAASAELDDKIYVIGGWTFEEGELSVVEYLDINSETWTRIADLNIIRGTFRACVINRYIYAVGGECSENTIEEYDPVKNEWKVIEIMTGKDIETFATLALNLCM